MIFEKNVAFNKHHFLKNTLFYKKFFYKEISLKPQKP